MGKGQMEISNIWPFILYGPELHPKFSWPAEKTGKPQSRIPIGKDNRQGQRVA